MQQHQWLACAVNLVVHVDAVYQRIAGLSGRI